jgi:hypothetical protein
MDCQREKGDAREGETGPLVDAAFLFPDGTKAKDPRETTVKESKSGNRGQA